MKRLSFSWSAFTLSEYSKSTAPPSPFPCCRAQLIAKSLANQAAMNALARTLEPCHQLHMRRPDELVDRLHLEKPVAARHQDRRVAREARRAARDRDDAGHARAGEHRA